MKFLTAILLLTQLITASYGQCGPAQCYTGCTDARVPLDVVFIIDSSGSMQEEINGVITGLSQFASDLETQAVIPWFSLILFGVKSNEAVLKLNAEPNVDTFKTKMSEIRVDGGWEPGLESIRRAVNGAIVNNFNITFREGSKRAIVLLTDEDSDPAYFAQNRPQLSGNDGKEECNPQNYTDWQDEINLTAKSIINLGASTYFMVKTGKTAPTCLTARQYGDYDLQVQSPDFKTFDATATLQKLKTNNVSESLQGKLLASRFLSRVFKVEDCSNSTFVKNFFETITADVSACDNKCLRYKCSALNTCLPPENICGCDGEPNSGRVPDANGNCFYCGNGVIDEGETCDLGAGNNVKGSGCFECVVEKGSSKNVYLIAGLAGGLAALVFVVLSAYFGYEYAKRRGLLGKGQTAAAAAASATNPMPAPGV